MSNASKHLCEELGRLVDRFRIEYDLTYAEAIGAFELIKAELIAEAISDDEEEDEFDDMEADE